MAMTIEQIAKELGVSITTVKLVHSGKADKYRISKKTQQRVLEFIDKNGIIVNQTARSLKLKKSNTIGLIVPSVTNVFFSSLIEQFERAMNKRGYQLITVSSEDNQNKGTSSALNLIERGVDGLFVVPNSAQQQLDITKKFPNKPIIFLDQDFQVDEHSIVLSDNYEAFYELTNTVWQKQVNETFVISGDSQLPSIRSRLEGFVDSSNTLNKSLPLNWLYAVPHNTFECGYDGMKALVNDIHRTPESVIFSSLPILEGALHFLKKHKGVIPTTLVIGTFDDHTMLDFLPNPVISVQQNAFEIAEQAQSLMQKALDKKSLSDRIIIPAKVLCRD